MKILIKTSVSGHGFSYGPGEKVNLPKAQATNWIKAGIAEKIVEKQAKPKPKK